jgi:hypothetical protein
MLTPMAATAHDLALRYLLELSADIRGALLMDPDGELLATAGRLPSNGLDATAHTIMREVGRLATGEDRVVEVDSFTARGAMFVLAEAGHVMVCTTNRAVNPGLIFYDMHAVLRDIGRAAESERRRETGDERREAAGSGA